jgi:hypothetical protein
MRVSRATTYLAGTAIAVAAFVVGWRYYDALVPSHQAPVSQASNTAVLGSYGQPNVVAPAVPNARSFPAPPAPKGADVEVVPQPSGQALAVWSQEGTVHGARFAGGRWTDAKALEEIRGEVSDLELAGNDAGAAMAVWRHTVGEIQSLRYARWSPESGWAAPDVIPGVLPRRLNSGARPSLMMDETGNVTLQWPSGFGGTSAQVTRFEAGRGWTQPLDVAAR